MTKIAATPRNPSKEETRLARCIWGANFFKNEWRNVKRCKRLVQPHSCESDPPVPTGPIKRLVDGLRSDIAFRVNIALYGSNDRYLTLCRGLWRRLRSTVCRQPRRPRPRFAASAQHRLRSLGAGTRHQIWTIDSPPAQPPRGRVAGRRRRRSGGRTGPQWSARRRRPRAAARR